MWRRGMRRLSAPIAAGEDSARRATLVAMGTDDDPLQRLIARLRERGCHSAILYGSRARGDQDAESDWDVVAFADHGSDEHDVSPWNPGTLDVFIYAREPDDLEVLLRAAGGRVLFEREGFATSLLARLQRLLDSGPKALSPQEHQVHRAWVQKSLERARRGEQDPDDIEAHHRRVWLQVELLEIYFQLRDRWFRGPKESFLWLRNNDPETWQAFQRALDTGTLDSLALLAQRVLSTGASPRL